ncbi:uncharacterized protein E0L32_011234 [Thyridium curvatum]|uniref:Mitochondrial distribution and morphology protein 12 n=1 Tax=Thyridium curvatum TaxID=1093900 RepID=A0A507BHS3_9PEZI|nr:uncharacterized protein E0L32_011234 [Thyridium curvatum]TPX19073.1 hypothetical protein E0L32_011234 [Thyridium curvatum]
MSIDLNWETLTTGPDGEALAHSIRDFIHTKFQSVPLPRFIKSVTVHDFQFGSIPPELELKDLTDPLPDFYEENEAVDDDEDDDDYDEGGSGFEDEDAVVPDEVRAAADRRRRAEAAAAGLAHDARHLPPHIRTGDLRAGGTPAAAHDLGSPYLGVSTPGIPGGTSNLSYFHSHLTSGLSGTQTPLAAVAGAHLGSGWLESAGGGGGHGHGHGPQEQQQRRHHPPSHSRNPSTSSISVGDFSPRGLAPTIPPNAVPTGAFPSLREKHSVSTLAPTSANTSRPPTRDLESAIEDEEGEDGAAAEGLEGQERKRFRERRVEDMQAVFRIRYAGDVKLLLTAEILLDYPMPSFVGIPLRLSITGLTFDGVGVLAYIRKRVHFCFLSPEDAVAAVGADSLGEGDADGHSSGGHGKMGGLLQEIQVESEIGQREGGKQSLKNVGKVERFVLEQVRRIFEEEFVYPSFWTFLV